MILQLIDKKIVLLFYDIYRLPFENQTLIMVSILNKRMKKTKNAYNLKKA